MGIVGRLDQYASMLAGEFDDYSMSENLFLYSEQFDNAYWTKSNSTISSNQIAAPDGTLTADKWIPNNLTIDPRLWNTTTRPDATYAFSFYAKSAGFTQFRTNILGRIPNEREIRVLWDLTAVSFTVEVGSAFGSANIQNVGNGWFKCIITYTKSGTATDLEVRPMGATATGDGTSGLYIWGAQLENGSTATDYTPTTTTAKTRVLPSTTNTNITGFSTYFSSGFSENVGAATTLVANVFPPYQIVYDEFAGTLFGSGQGRLMRQNTDKSVIVYNEIDEVSDFRDIVRTGLVLDLDAAQPLSYKGTGTTWNDLSGNGNNGTLTNGPTFSSSNGGSIVFDGNDDKVTFPNNTISTTAGITVEVWFKTSSGTKYQDIFDLDDAYGVWITTNYASVGTGKITASFNTIYGGIMSVNYSIDTWYQVVISGSGTSNTLYLNATNVATASQTVATSVNLNTARIGNVDGDRAAEYLIGNVASLKFYNRALTATEVLQNYNALKHRFGL